MSHVVNDPEPLTVRGSAPSGGARRPGPAGRFPRRRLWPLKVGFLMLLALVAAAPSAETYPSKPVRLVSPLSPGGPLDSVARVYAVKLQALWRQPVIVDNRVGASGTIGTGSVVQSPADGHTLLMTLDMPIVISPSVIKVPYDPRKDLVPVVAFGSSMNLLVVHPSLKVNSLSGLVAAARASPGRLAFSSAGVGSPGHLCAEMIKTAAGIDMTHVPYKGAAPAMLAALSGEVNVFCGPVGEVLRHVRAGKMVALGVTGRTPSTHAPEIAPIADTYPDVLISDWYGVFAPAGTPAHVVKTIRDAMRAVGDDPEVRRKSTELGLDPLWMEQADLIRAIEADLSKWAAVVRKAGIRND